MAPPLIWTTVDSVALARRVLERERAVLKEHDVPGELTLTGGSSMPGLLTKGDIDLHLRVRAEDFPRALDGLRALYGPVHAEIWTGSLAAFERPGDPTVGIAVTAIGTEHDRRFTSGWSRLAAEARLREEYNAIKSADGDYEHAKSQFFDRIAEGDAGL